MVPCPQDITDRNSTSTSITVYNKYNQISLEANYNYLPHYDWLLPGCIKVEYKDQDTPQSQDTVVL